MVQTLEVYDPLVAKIEAVLSKRRCGVDDGDLFMVYPKSLATLGQVTFGVAVPIALRSHFVCQDYVG